MEFNRNFEKDFEILKKLRSGTNSLKKDIREAHELLVERRRMVLGFEEELAAFDEKIKNSSLYIFDGPAYCQLQEVVKGIYDK